MRGGYHSDFLFHVAVFQPLNLLLHEVESDVHVFRCGLLLFQFDYCCLGRSTLVVDAFCHVRSERLEHLIGVLELVTRDFFLAIDVLLEVDDAV